MKNETEYSEKVKKIYEVSKMTEKDQKLIPLSKWNDYYDYPTVAALRQLKFYNKNQFVEEVTRRICNRIYISVPDFFAWVDKNGQRG